MIKYKVILQDGSAEFTDEHIANTYKNDNGGLSIEIIDEPAEPFQFESRQTPMWSLRAVITMMGLANQVETLLNALPEPNKTVALIAWAYGNFIDINATAIAYLQTGLNLTNDQVVQIFDQSDALFV